MKKNLKDSSKRKAAATRNRNVSIKNTAATRAKKIKVYAMKQLEKEVRDWTCTQPENFVNKVETLLSLYADRIDGGGIAALGENGKAVFPILENIGADLEDFKNTFKPIQDRASAFLAIKAEVGNVESYKARGTDIILDAQSILESFASLHLVSHQSLLTIKH